MIDTMTEPRYLSLRQVADRLGLSERTVRRMVVEKGELKAYQFGGVYRISEDDLNKYIEANRIEASDAYELGHEAGYEKGYEKGYEEGYEKGYEKGGEEVSS